MKTSLMLLLMTLFIDTLYEHLEHIRIILVVLRNARMTAKASKCMLAFQQIEFLAHIVGN